MSHKRVLILASKSESQEPALIIAEELKRNGYSPVFCNVGGDTVKVKEDRPLAVGMPTTDIVGVVVLDDGGDEKATLEIIAKANKAGQVVAGFALGCILMRNAGAFKGQHVCSGFEADFYEGSTQINSPATRSGNIVSCSSPSCVNGFAVLLVGALGGKAKNMVTSEFNGPSSLVVAETVNWPRFWDLAFDLSKNGVKLLIAESTDLDFKTKKANYALLLDCDEKKVKAVTASIPKMFLLQEQKPRVELAQELEKIGCVGFNSCEAEETLADQLKVYKILNSLFSKGARPIESEDADKVTLAGSSYWLISKAGRRKASGKGSMTILSAGKDALILSPDEIKIVISEYKKNDGLIQPDFGKDMFEGHQVSFGYLVKDNRHDVDVCHAYAKVNNKCFEYLSVARAVFGSKFSEFDVKAKKEAVEAALLIKSELRDPDGLRLLSVEFDSVESTPIIKMAGNEYSIGQEAPTAVLEKAVGVNMPKMPPDRQPQISDAGRKEDIRVHKRLLERALAHEGIFIQPDGSVVVSSHNDSNHVELSRAISFVQKQARQAADEVIRKERAGSSSEKKRAELVAGSLRYRLRLLLAYYDTKNAKKKALAYTYDDSIPGPYSNVDLPMSERVMKYQEGDDWLEDKDKYIRNQPRYNPEYYQTGDANNTFGVYYIWEEPRRSPYYWSRILTEGIYPSTGEYNKP